jgi:hypothetical protein
MPCNVLSVDLNQIIPRPLILDLLVGKVKHSGQDRTAKRSMESGLHALFSHIRFFFSSVVSHEQ